MRVAALLCRVAGYGTVDDNDDDNEQRRDNERRRRMWVWRKRGLGRDKNVLRRGGDVGFEELFDFAEAFG